HIVLTRNITIPESRVSPIHRRFNSTIVEQTIESMKQKLNSIGLTNLGVLFENCWPNTLDTTVLHHDPIIPDTFIITGDIPAMWLRDSTDQVTPYLPLLSSPSPPSELVKLFQGLILRQAKSINRYPYANAFLYNASDPPGWPSDRVYPPIPSNSDIPTHEAKYELDSLCAFLKISNSFFESLNDQNKDMSLVFLLNSDWARAVEMVLKVMRVQQRGTMEELGDPAYTFVRSGDVVTDSLMLNGVGVPAKRCGLIKSPFRSSDDAATFPFNIAANAMAAVELMNLAKLLDYFQLHSTISIEARELSSEIRSAIQTHGIVNHPVHGTLYAYEVDGFGSYYLMDDAGIPSLLSLPYLGFVSPHDPVYKTTRSFVLSDSNPYYFKGSAGEGVGGPHIGLGYIWPMGIIVRGITSVNETERRHCFEMLLASAEGTGFMHESYWMDNFQQFTRSHFAWVNGLLGEFVLDSFVF
ncbi:hypothetical protein BDR26DRAFT_799681, partial [Obelidium mucronatum]